MSAITLNKQQILEYQQNRDPYLMIDHATEIIPGVSSKGYKNLSKDEWFFQVHWPSDPNMPGMLQIESMVQMCSLSILSLPGNKGKIMYLVSANNIKLIKKVTPNCKFKIETFIDNYKRGMAFCRGIGYVENSIVSKADFIIILPDEVKKFK